MTRLESVTPLLRQRGAEFRRQLVYAAKYSLVLLVIAAILCVPFVVAAHRIASVSPNLAAGFLSGSSARTVYWQLLRAYHSELARILLVMAVLIPLLIFIAHVVTALVDLVASVLSHLLLDVDRGAARRREFYKRALRARTIRTLLFAAIAYLAFGVCLGAAIHSHLETPEEIVSALGWYFVGAVPWVFGVGWYALFRIRQRARSYYLDVHLFSQRSVRANFVALAAALVSFAAIAWVILPPALSIPADMASEAAARLHEDHRYEERWNDIMSQGNSPDDFPRRGLLALPEPSALERSFFIFSDRGDYAEWAQAFPLLMARLFLAVTVGAILAVGIPAILAASIFESYRKALRAALIATLKSAVLVGLMRLFIEKAYMIDGSRVVGTSALFLLAVSFFLSQDAVEVAVPNPGGSSRLRSGTTGSA